MEQTTREIQIIMHANGKDEAFMHCPQCGAFKKMNTSSSRLINQADGVEIQCDACAHKYKVLINYRKHYRKNASLKGIYTNATDSIDQAFDFDTTSAITVGNISRTGIGFRTQDAVNVKADNVLKVRFILDDNKKSLVEKTVIVKRVDKDFIGAEFIKAIDYRDKEFAFYLMRR
ncbi:MAG: hypothetical protein RQ760_18720 [Sedimentisphaerales bacterium]|nr:hypothetical protein [Sedimentisphaerales bacterium]